MASDPHNSMTADGRLSLDDKAMAGPAAAPTTASAPTFDAFDGGSIDAGNVPDDKDIVVVHASTDDSQAEPQYVTGIKLWLIMLALSLVLVVTMLDVSIVATAIPHITSEFHSLNDVGWYGSAYHLAWAPMQPLSGKFYTYFSTKWVFLICFGVFELGSLICGVAQSSGMLIAGRAVAGLGAAGLQNGALTVLAGLAPLARRAMLTGIIMGVSQLGVVAGPLLGGVFTELATWRWCFYVNLPVGGVVFALLLLVHIPEQTTKMPWRGQPKTTVQRQLRLVFLHRLDLCGFFLFAGATTQLLLALQWGGGVGHPWNSSVVVGLLVGAGVTGLVWIGWNYRMSQWRGSADIPNIGGEAALVPTPLLRKRVVVFGILTPLTMMGGMMIHSFFIAIYFQAVHNATPIISGVNILPNIISQLLAAVVASSLMSKLGYYQPWAVVGMALTSVGMGLLTTLAPATPARNWIGFQILTGAGRGMTFQGPFLAIQHAVDPRDVSVALGLLSFGQNFGGAVWMIVANAVFGQMLTSQLAQNAPGVHPADVVDAGATAFRDVVPAASVPGVILSYANSVDRVFYMGMALSIASFFCAFGLGWVDIRKEKPSAAAEETEGATEVTDAQPPASRSLTEDGASTEKGLIARPNGEDKQV